MTHRIVALGVALCSTSALVNAQPQGEPQSQRLPAPASPSTPTVSLRVLLQLQGDQDAKLNRLYEEYASRRAEEEERFASRQSGHTPASEGRLQREQVQAQQRIANTLLSKRQQSFKVLGAVQRSQLQAFSHDSRFKIKRDRYCQLLLLPVEDLGRTPLDMLGSSASSGNPSSSRGSNRSRSSGSYGVYGGYSYGGPSYGVYGNVGRGSVGVQAGIGRGGPSIGIGIGRVFGGFGF